MKPGAESRSARHEVIAVVALTGEQRTHVEVHNGGTAEATATMTVGRALMYVRTQAAAAQLGALADRATRKIPRLPALLPARPPHRPPAGEALASIITHISGAPGGVVRLMPQNPPRIPYLHLQIGELVFHLRDRAAARSCIQALHEVATIRGQLSVLDPSQTSRRSRPPRFAGADAEQARDELTRGVPRSSTRAQPIADEPLETTLARGYSALATARAAFAQLDSVHRASLAFQPPPSGTPNPPVPPQQSAPTTERSAPRPDRTPNRGRTRAP